MESKGKLIVIEGIDGTGKRTQADLLKSRMEEVDRQCEIISFPRYRHPAAYFEERYLRPDSPYGSPEEVGPYRASLFFALDRYDAGFQIRRWLESGAIIVADRYLVSNAAHQGGKITDDAKRLKYVRWLYELEYELLEIPKPDLNIILTLPIEVSRRRVLQKHARLYLDAKKGAKDAHELDDGHLTRAQDAYLWMAKQYPEEFCVIDCAQNGRELSIEEVHEKVWEASALVNTTSAKV